MFKRLVIMNIGILVCAGSFVLATEIPQKEDKVPYNFHGEVDNTDIYAIPLDSSEEEQEEELKELEQESNKSKSK